MLPYTAEVYFALLERYLAHMAPAGLVAELLAMAALLAVMRALPAGDRAIGAYLAVGWLVTGAVFHGHYFAGIHFLAPVYAALFVVQGLLLAWAGPVRGRLMFRFRGDTRGWVGLGLAVVALAYPLLDGLWAGEWLGLRPPGLTPSPTVVLTLGLLLLTPKTPRHLLIIPGLWALPAAHTAWYLAVPTDALPLLALAASACPFCGEWLRGVSSWRR